MQTRFPGLVGLAVGALALGSCTGEPGRSEFDHWLCEPSDLPGQFHELARGELTSRDIAELAGASRSATETIVNGDFVFYSEALDSPPFEAPLDVVCQVLEFEDEAAAEDWVTALAPEVLLQASAFTWIPDDHEILEVDDWDWPPSGTVARKFELTARNDPVDVAAVVAVWNVGRIVVALSAGSNQPSLRPETLAFLEGVTANWVARLAEEPIPR